MQQSGELGDVIGVAEFGLVSSFHFKRDPCPHCNLSSNDEGLEAQGDEQGEIEMHGSIVVGECIYVDDSDGFEEYEATKMHLFFC